ncbi:MAG TPA: glycoside hydrolase family 9 protein [Candidatus Lokiarchaeia archaeon]|nr:glycoside hydrolase family 9 protein [Candidatus Lokiarchaeia archaeon]
MGSPCTQLKRTKSVAILFMILPPLISLAVIFWGVHSNTGGISLAQMFTAPIYTGYGYTLLEGLFDFDKFFAEFWFSLIFCIILTGYIVVYGKSQAEREHGLGKKELGRRTWIFGTITAGFLVFTVIGSMLKWGLDRSYLSGDPFNILADNLYPDYFSEEFYAIVVVAAGFSVIVYRMMRGFRDQQGWVPNRSGLKYVLIGIGIIEVLIFVFPIKGNLFFTGNAFLELLSAVFQTVLIVGIFGIFEWKEINGLVTKNQVNLAEIDESGGHSSAITRWKSLSRSKLGRHLCLIGMAVLILLIVGGTGFIVVQPSIDISPFRWFQQALIAIFRIFFCLFLYYLASYLQRAKMEHCAEGKRWIAKIYKTAPPVDARSSPRRDKKRMYTSLFVMNLILIGTVVSVKAVYFPPTIVMNQVGFLPDNPKTFFVKSQMMVSQVYYQILDANGKIISDDQGMTYLGQLWGFQYYQGDFSKLTTPGIYSIRAFVDDNVITSPRFEIAWNAYDLSLERAYEFFYYQRSGCVVNELIPGYPGHGMDHADDYAMIDGTRLGLTGGWFSAGDYSKANYFGTEIFGGIYSMLFAYQQRPDLYTRIDVYSTNGNLTPDGIPDILNEAMWGVQYAAKLTLANYTILGTVSGKANSRPPETDTDQINGTADDRTLVPYLYYANYDDCLWLAAGLAKFVNILNATPYFPAERAGMSQAAEHIYAAYSHYYDKSAPVLDPVTGAAFLAASEELGNMTGNRGYDDNATWAALAMMSTINNDTTRPVIYGGTVDRAVGLIIQWALGTQNSTYIALARDMVLARWTTLWAGFATDPSNFYDLIQVHADATTTSPAQWAYFQSLIGENNLYLYAIYALAMGYAITGGSIPQMKTMLLAMINWLFGQNPEGVCMMESLGSVNLPTYHHRYRFEADNPRGAVPGEIPNGYVLQDGRPYLDIRTGAGSVGVSEIDWNSAEPWIVHNVAFLYAMPTVSSMF